jgi:hypothetical protein
MMAIMIGMNSILNALGMNNKAIEEFWSDCHKEAEEFIEKEKLEKN